MLLLIPIVLASIAAPPAVADRPAAMLRLERSLDAMGTTYTIAVYGKDRWGLDEVMDEAFDEAQRLDRLLSNYRQDSEISALNREAAQRAVPVSAELFDLLQKCLEYSRQSDGAFDITVGPLMKIWGFYKADGRIPHRAEIRMAMSRVGWRHVLLDAKARTVRFDAPVEIDPGGIGKGYAVDRMAAILRRRGVTSGVISAGRSSIYAIGTPPDEPRGWLVTIPDPRNLSKVAAEYYLKDSSLSTSGNAEKFFVAGGVTYSHIMDPRTGAPSRGMLEVSVVAPRTLDSEAWTKPYFILGRQWAAQHKPKSFHVFLCEDRSEIACEFLP